MLDNTNSAIQNDPGGFDYEAGAPVWDAAGNKIGSLSELGVQHGCLVVRHGILPPRDAYVPLEHIARLEQDGIFLNLGKDDLKTLGRERNAPAPQAHEMGATTGVTDATTTQPAPVHLRLLAGQSAAAGLEEPLTTEGTLGTAGTARTADTMSDSEGELRVPVREEELVTGKRAPVTDEVRIGTRKVTEQQQVSDTVRKEQVNVDQTGGDKPVMGSTSLPVEEGSDEGTVPPTP
jgi:hypothetical protein